MPLEVFYRLNDGSEGSEVMPEMMDCLRLCGLGEV